MSSASLDAARARLKTAGLRITQPRLAILAELIRLGEPASIEGGSTTGSDPAAAIS